MSFLQSVRHMGATGLIATVLGIAFCVNVFIVIDGHSHSVSDTLYNVFPYWVPTFLLWAWIVEHAARRRTAD
ncbi:MAG: hypothetical protein ACXU8U_03275 [Asticcacaulis sp.]